VLQSPQGKRVLDVGCASGTFLVAALELGFTVTGIELARHTFFSESELSPGRIKTLVASSTRPPSRVISVRMLIDNDSGTYGEQVSIKHIIYADGSVWEAR